MSETKKDMLNRLYKEYGLTKEDVFSHKNFTIITRGGINKIEAKANVEVEFEVIDITKELITRWEKDYKGNDVLAPYWFTSVSLFANAKMGDKTIQTTGEADNSNVQQKPSYILAMAEKRARSRAVLILTGLYAEGVFSEDEADEFKDVVRKARKEQASGGIDRQKVVFKG